MSFGRDTNIGYPDANSASTDILLASILVSLTAGITTIPVSPSGADLDDLITKVDSSLTQLKTIRAAGELLLDQDLAGEDVE